jgi:uncharacterized protein YajQ (UPF0234 family)
MPSFDIVSKTDLAEVANAVQGVAREIATRFDFKGAKATITLDQAMITLLADDAMKLKQMQELVKGYFVRRKLDPNALDWKEEERAAGDMRRQLVAIRQGIEGELARTIIKAIKDAKLKVQAAIQGDELRVSAKKRDELQATIQLVRQLAIERPLQYVNFRD